MTDARKSYCGGRLKRREGTCTRPPGWGTDHPGAGRCKLHGGSAPSGSKAGRLELARQQLDTYGTPREINTTDALEEELHFSAGHVAWLRTQLAQLEAGDLVWGVTEQVEKSATEFPGTDTTHAATMNIWLDLYHKERRYFLDVTKAAVTAGLEERRVKLAEAQGAILNDLIRRILGRLDLTPAQSRLVAKIVPEELRRAATSSLN